MAFESRNTPIALWTLVCGCLVGILGLLAVMNSLAEESGPKIVVHRAEPKDSEVLSYIAVYLIPFLGIDLTELNDVVLFGSFLVVLGVVYVNSNMLFTNPLLSLIGFHTFEIRDREDHSFTVLTRRRDFAEDITIEPAQIDRYLRVEARRQRGGA
jgi:hypothetical protein